MKRLTRECSRRDMVHSTRGHCTGGGWTETKSRKVLIVQVWQPPDDGKLLSATIYFCVYAMSPLCALVFFSSYRPEVHAGATSALFDELLRWVFLMNLSFLILFHSSLCVASGCFRWKWCLILGSNAFRIMCSYNEVVIHRQLNGAKSAWLKSVPEIWCGSHPIV